VGESPIWPKVSHQASSEVHRQTRQRESGAGWSKIAGSVLSPEKCIVVVRKDNSRKSEGKADALDAAEGSRPACAMASVQVTTGVLDQGMFSKG